MATSNLLGQMKHFVKSSDGTPTSIVDTKAPPKLLGITATGTVVKQFYEKTLGKKALQALQSKLKSNSMPEKSKIKNKLLKIPFNGNLLMKEVEAGNAKVVMEMLEAHHGAVNYQDQFGWTPLMAACCAGNLLMVQLLLRWKPDLSASDKQGNTCKKLAMARGHQTILDILKQYSRDLYEPKLVPNSTQSVQSFRFYCQVCQQDIENTSIKKHLLSTIHNFNTASKSKMPTMYGIPESNKGFQILMRSGWNKEDGLGPSGDGHKYPPKTILKQDRTGLGAKKYKARVTHTLEGPQREVTPKNTFKRNLKYEKRKEQRLERNLRMMLS